MTTPLEYETILLPRRSGGEQEELGEVMSAVYDELRRLARRYLSRERPNHTLQPTALVHEAYLRLTRQNDLHWQNRAHFFAIAARSMREILVEYARGHQAAKRGGDGIKMSLSAALTLLEERDVDLLALDEALNRLAALDPQKCRIVELRAFAGLTLEETAEVLATSTATVTRQWRIARAWLYREMNKAEAQP
jgi:RNA polymerase sigma factor (TIGR02999 family)